MDERTYYGSEQDPFETLRFIEAKEFNFHLGNVIKYISRAGKKDTSTELEDLRKAKFYLDRYIQIKENKPF